MKITKTEILQKLYEIAETQKMNLDKEVQATIRNEIIPIDVIKLINRYDKKFLQIYDTYNVIFKSRFKNPLYKNLRHSDKLPDEEIAIALSSLVTKILISCSKILDLKERKLYSQAMNVEGINRAIELYLMDNNNELLEHCAKEVRDLLTILYEDGI